MLPFKFLVHRSFSLSCRCFFLWLILFFYLFFLVRGTAALTTFCCCCCSAASTIFHSFIHTHTHLYHTHSTHTHTHVHVNMCVCSQILPVLYFICKPLCTHLLFVIFVLFAFYYYFFFRPNLARLFGASSAHECVCDIRLILLYSFINFYSLTLIFVAVSLGN